MGGSSKKYEMSKKKTHKGRTDHPDESVSIRISRETIDKLLDWVDNEQRRLKGLPKRKKTVLKFNV